MSHSQLLRGVYVIVVTPFDEGGDIDEESLRSVVDFCIEAGSHGLVTPANASEFYALADAERRRIGQIVVEQANGRIPIVLTATGVSANTAVEFVQAAQDDGADALMAMPPPIRAPAMEGVFDYYRAISKAAQVPVIVQNSTFVGKPMSPDFLARLVDELDGIHYIKEESDPCTHVASRITELVQNKEKLHGIFGGQAGRHLMNELARGVCGTMPACDVPDANAAIWNAWESGDHAEARRLYNRLLPLLNMESLYPLQLYKEVLRRRGVIRNAKVRNAFQTPMDKIDQKELDAIMDEIEGMLTIGEWSVERVE